MKLRLVMAIAAVVACVQVRAADTMPAGQTRYLVKLKYLFVQPNASAPAPIQDVVTNAGGHIESEWFDRLVVSIPEAAAVAVLNHPATKYIQRVITGSPQSVANPAQTRPPMTTNSLRVKVPDSVPPWDSGTYSYDGAGNIKAIGADTYTYDALSRLSQTNVRGHNETYTFDTFGNLTRKQTDSLTVDLSVDDGGHNQLKNFGSYDTAGNLTGDSNQSARYDPFNMVREKNISSGVHEYYLYNAQDERIAVVSDPCPGQLPPSCTSSLVTLSFRDEQGKVLRQFDIPYSQFSTTVFNWLEDYVYRDGLLLAAERMAAEGGRRNFHLDHLGTPRLVTGPNGQHYSEHDYYPFGVEITSLAQEVPAGFDREEPMKFTGHLRDFNTSTSSDNENYDDYMHARNTSPQWARFFTPDPFGGRLTSSQSWNRYAYVRGNPIARRDPYGLSDVTVALNCGDTSGGRPCVVNAGITVTARDPGWLSSLLFTALLRQMHGDFSEAEVLALQGKSYWSSYVMNGGTIGRVYGAPVVLGPFAAGSAPLIAASEVEITEAGLGEVETNLARYDPYPPNESMLARLRAALAGGTRLTGADAAFYQHELMESALIRQGIDKELAHQLAFEKLSMSPYAVYHPDVVMTYYPAHFNLNWLEYWGLK